LTDATFRRKIGAMRKLSLLLALSLLTVRSAWAPFFPPIGTPLSNLVAAGGLRCTFSSAQGINPLKPWPTPKSITVNETLHFDNIDLQKNTARLIAAVGIPGIPGSDASDVLVQPNDAGIYFIEVEPMAITLTFVFAEVADSGGFKAASSRHTMFPVHPSAIPSQEYGTCTVDQTLLPVDPDRPPHPNTAPPG